MPSHTTKNETKGLIKSFVIALFLALLFRSLLFEPFHIPSGSMKSTLLIGDYIFVSKYSYGYSRYSFPFGFPLWEGRVGGREPERGDVVVFRLPRDPSTNYIKRLIGLPGDRVQMRQGVLYINDEATPKKRIEDFIDYQNGHAVTIPRYIETLDNGVSYTVLDQHKNDVWDNTPVYTVPEGQYFFMGDNRDNSSDSRTSQVGYVDEQYLVGNAEFIFFTKEFAFWEAWKWFDHDVDKSRSFSFIQ